MIKLKNILRISIVVLILILPFSLFADDKVYGNVIVSRIVRVYDGDTFTVDIDNWPDIIGYHISVRVYGIDTPEIKGKTTYERMMAKKARDLARNILYHAHKIELRNIRRGKYFRIVAEVYVDGRNLADIMLAHKLAHPYYGGHKISW